MRQAREVLGRFDLAGDAGTADAPEAGVPARCDRESAPLAFKNRFLVTEANDDMARRRSRSGLGAPKKSPRSLGEPGAAPMAALARAEAAFRG